MNRAERRRAEKASRASTARAEKIGKMLLDRHWSDEWHFDATGVTVVQKIGRRETRYEGV